MTDCKYPWSYLKKPIPKIGEIDSGVSLSEALRLQSLADTPMKVLYWEKQVEFARKRESNLS